MRGGNSDPEKRVVPEEKLREIEAKIRDLVSPTSLEKLDRMAKKVSEGRLVRRELAAFLAWLSGSQKKWEEVSRQLDEVLGRTAAAEQRRKQQKTRNDAFRR